MKRRNFKVDKFILNRNIEFGRKHMIERSSPKIRNFQSEENFPLNLDSGGGGGDEEQRVMTS